MIEVAFSPGGERVKDEVVVYTTTNCSRCHLVKSFLTQNAIPFREVSLLRQDGAIEELQRLTGSFEAPVTVVGKHFIRGYDPVALTALLEEEGWL